MQIKVENRGDSTSVEVVNPASEEVLSSVALAAQQAVTVTAVNAHEPSDIEVGEVAELS